MGLKKLKAIRSQIEAAQGEAAMKTVTLQNEASIVFAKMMGTKSRQKALLALVSQVENTKELTQTENDEYFSQWVRADFSTLIDTDDEFQKEMLAQFLEENHCVRADFQNEAVSYSIGPCIIVNHEGDVLDQDSGKWFISKRDYETEAERNSLIEAYMDKTGCFPSVVYCDYHGNASYLDTQSPEQKIANKKLMEAQNESGV